VPAIDDQAEGLEGALARARGGSREALGEAILAARGTMKREALRALPAGWKEEASDLVAVASLKAVEHFAEFRGETAAEFRGWLRAIVRHGAFTIARQRPAPGPLPVGGAEPVGSSGPDAKARRRERAIRLRRAIAQLSDRDRDLMRWRFTDGQTFDEIGKRLGVSKVAAHRAFGLAALRLSRMLSKLADDSTLGVEPDGD